MFAKRGEMFTNRESAIPRMIKKSAFAYGHGSDTGGHIPTLYALAKYFAPIGILIELGVNKGYSTLGLLTGVHETCGKLVSYDTRDCRQNVMQTIDKDMSLLKHWQFIQLDSISASKNWQNNSVALVYIDTVHSYEQTKKELEQWTPKLKKEGAICGHDYNLSWYNYGVRRAVDEWAKEQKERFELQIIPHDRGLFILWPI